MDTYNHLRVVKKTKHSSTLALDLHELIEADDLNDERTVQAAYLGSLRRCLEVDSCQGLIEKFWDIEHCLQEIPMLHPSLMSLHSQLSSNLLRILWELTQSPESSELQLERCLNALRLSLEEEIALVTTELDELSTVKNNSDH
jgi:hypothetical protein